MTCQKSFVQGCKFESHLMQTISHFACMETELCEWIGYFCNWHWSDKGDGRNK